MSKVKKKEVALTSVCDMSVHQMRTEIRNTRRTIRKWVEAYNKAGNERCHELDEALARLVGMTLYPGRAQGIMSASVFAQNCTAYNRRECRRGRLVDDLPK